MTEDTDDNDVEINTVQMQIKSNVTLFYCVPFKVCFDIEASDFFPQSRQKA